MLILIVSCNFVTIQSRLATGDNIMKQCCVLL